MRRETSPVGGHDAASPRRAELPKAQRPAPARVARVARRSGILVLGAVLVAGCAGDPAPAPVTAMPPAVREELSKLRADLADQRAATELVRRAAIEHVDRRSLELRAEIQAVQAVTQAEMRHVEQRVDEVKPPRPVAPPDGLDARLAALTERIQTLERKVAESSRPSAPVPAPPPPAAAPAPTAASRGGVSPDQLRALAARSAEVAAAAHLQLGDLAASAGDSERATSEYLRAVEIAPRGPDASRALLALGDAYRKAGRTRLAREAWSRAIRDFPGSDGARAARTRLDAKE